MTDLLIVLAAGLAFAGGATALNIKASGSLKVASFVAIWLGALVAGIALVRIASEGLS